MQLAIIIPALDEARVIEGTLERLGPLRTRGVKVILVDGGSSDATASIAASLADRVVPASRGRALQMNAGAASPEAQAADVLLFLHADTELPDEADLILTRALSKSRCDWGFFPVSIAGRSRWLSVVATSMNARSRLTGIATGDQALFVKRAMFVDMAGFAPIPLMEDVDFSTRARRLSRPVVLDARVRTSGRRWDQQGALRTILQMWRLRLAFALGVEPANLARRYGHSR